MRAKKQKVPTLAKMVLKCRATRWKKNQGKQLSARLRSETVAETKPKLCIILITTFSKWSHKFNVHLSPWVLFKCNKFRFLAYSWMWKYACQNFTLAYKILEKSSNGITFIKWNVCNKYLKLFIFSEKSDEKFYNIQFDTKKAKKKRKLKNH